jgi:hypothetical protein
VSGSCVSCCKTTADCGQGSVCCAP